MTPDPINRSKNSTARCARDASPVLGSCPPPIIPAAEITRLGARRTLRTPFGRDERRRVVEELLQGAGCADERGPEVYP
jgi:hypothetical protein